MRWFAATFASVLLVACGDDQPASDGTSLEVETGPAPAGTSNDVVSTAPTAPPLDRPLNGVWRALDATVAAVEVDGLDTVEVTLEIRDDHISGSSGCNYYEQAIVVRDGTIEFGAASATEAFCTAAPGEIEALFRRLSSGSVGWSVDGRLLTLAMPESVWVFERTGDAPVAAPPATMSEPTAPQTYPSTDASWGGLDGPVIFAGPRDPNADVPTALALGPMRYIDGCLLLGEGDDAAVIVWPAGVRWQVEPPAVVLASGRSVAVGTSIEMAAAFYSGPPGDVISAPEALAQALRCGAGDREVVLVF